ncbi:Aste57867_20137 [Aphanomyces stellatus]|uniref:Aste57867_20137 protein n=1 Tax=Aphanomyces stellatus TaxID=120398 RepID=A0A485LEF8_9STRA|nr:hypothetical protein As57867_020071 [Aphanomyces stellatus]VFT96832.1 Aste57867_20137 [Aphanomyces stellatus]
MASSFNFYSLVSAVKDSSTKALATLSSDLKEFSSTVQGDVAEAAKEVKKKVEATIADRAEQTDKKEGDEDVKGTAAAKADSKHDVNDEMVLGEKGLAIKASLFAFGSRLESVGTKFFTTADEFLGSWVADKPQANPPLEELSSGRRFRLLALQEASETYLERPADFETYQKWKRNLSSEDFDVLQAEVLEHYPAVKEKLTALVPGALDADSFWGHYLYKASLLAAQEQRGALLLEKVGDDDEVLSWDLDSPTHADEPKDVTTTAGTVIVSSPSHARIRRADATTKTIPAPGRSDSGEASPKTDTPEEGWVDVSEKKTPAVTATVGAAADDDDDLNWGDDDVVLPTTTAATPAADSSAAVAVSTDDWGQWE